MTTAAYSTAIRARDFSSSTTDTFRDRWTIGKMRHVVAALEGRPVAIILDAMTGHAAVGVRLLAVRDSGDSNPGARVVVETTLSDGTTQRTNYRLDGIGGTIIPLDEPLSTAGAKWVAVRTHREEQGAAIRWARERHGEGRDRGRWTVRAFRDYVHVCYEPTEARYGRDATDADRFAYWSVRLDELAAVPAL